MDIVITEQRGMYLKGVGHFKSKKIFFEVYASTITFEEVLPEQVAVEILESLLREHYIYLKWEGTYLFQGNVKATISKAEVDNVLEFPA